MSITAKKRARGSWSPSRITDDMDSPALRQKTRETFDIIKSAMSDLEDRLDDEIQDILNNIPNPIIPGTITPGAAQPSATWSSTASVILSNTANAIYFIALQNNVKLDTTNHIILTSPDVITIDETGSYAVSVNASIRHGLAGEWRILLYNNGVQIPAIEIRQVEGDDQILEDTYNFHLSIQGIDLTAGTVRAAIKTISTSGTGTATLVTNTVVSLRQNRGVTGAVGPAGPPGSVASFSFTNANGISGTVTNPTTTPNLTLALGAITPSSVNGVVISGSSSPTLTVVGTGITGNAATATALQTARLINGVSFDGTADISNALDGLSDVVVPTPTMNDILTFDGSNWVNTPAASSLVTTKSFYLDTASSVSDSLTLLTTASAAVATTIVRGVTSANAPKLFDRFISGDLNQTSIPAGDWTFYTYGSTSNVTGNNFIQFSIRKRVLKSGMTATYTGSGATRTLTVSGGTPFVPGDANTNVLLAGLTETPTQTSWITTYTSSTVVTVTLKDSTFVNVSGVALTAIHYYLFNDTTADINSTSATLMTTVSSQASFTGMNATDRISVSYLAWNNQATNHNLTLYYAGTTTRTRVVAPINLAHNDLSGLNIGDYLHLTAAEYAGTGSGVFVKQTNASLVTPTLGVATATTVNKITITAPATGATLTIQNGFTLTVSANATVSGTNTGDQTSVSGNAGTATALQTARTINGTSFDGTANITVTAAAGTLTGATLNATVTASSLVSVGTITTGVWNGTKISEASGGTNQSTYTQGDLLYASAANTLSKLALGAAGQVLAVNGGGTQVVWSTAAGTGTVTSVSVTSAAGVSGSVATATTTPAITITLGTLTAGTWNATKISEAYGGTNQSTYATGDLLYASASNTLSKLALGSALQGLRVNAGGTNVEWATIAGTGTVTSVSVTTANGVSGTVATSTTTPAITLTLGAITPTSIHTSAGIIVDTTLLVTGVGTFTAAPVLSSTTASLPLATDASKNVITSPVTGTGSTIAMSVSPAFTGTVTMVNATMSGMMQLKKGGAVTQAATITLDGTGNMYKFANGTTNISYLTFTGIQSGSWILLLGPATGTATIKHSAASPGATACKFRNEGAVDKAMGVNDQHWCWLDNDANDNTGLWRGLVTSG